MRSFDVSIRLQHFSSPAPMPEPSAVDPSSLTARTPVEATAASQQSFHVAQSKGVREHFALVPISHTFSRPSFITFYHSTSHGDLPPHVPSSSCLCWPQAVVPKRRRAVGSVKSGKVVSGSLQGVCLRLPFPGPLHAVHPSSLPSPTKRFLTILPLPPARVPSCPSGRRCRSPSPKRRRRL